jgi:hypothetical protein
MKIFKRILRDPVLREPFQTFLEQQFCAENINFYLAVELFRDLAMNKDSTVSSSIITLSKFLVSSFLKDLH